jgi:hypothetical protein
MACVAGAFSIHGVVVAGASEALMLCLLGEGRLMVPSPHDAMRKSLVETSIMAHHRVDAPPQVDPVKGAQAAEVVSDELEVPEANCFARGQYTACQTLAIGGHGDCRQGNHHNI